MIGIILLFIFFYLLRRNKYSAFLALAVAFPTIILFNVGKLSVVSVVVILFVLNILNTYKKNKEIIYNYPFRIPTLILLSSYFGTFFFVKEKHLTTLINNISVFFIPWLYWIYKDHIPSNKIRKYIIIYSVIIVSYGLFEAIAGYNPIMDFLHKNKLVFSPEQRSDYIRFGIYRAQSLTYWCTGLGTIASCSLVYFLTRFFVSKEQSNFKFYILCIVLSIGVIIPGSRTVIVMTFIMMFSLLPYFNLNKTKVMPFIFLLGIVFLLNMDFFYDIIGSIITPDSLEGSDNQLRAAQLEISLEIMSRNPIWGNGLAFSAGAQDETDIFIGGLESIVFHTAIDRGIVGLVTLALFALISIVNVGKRYFYMIFIIIGYFFAKYNSLLPTLPITYIFFYYIIINDIYRAEHTLLCKKIE